MTRLEENAVMIDSVTDTIETLAMGGGNSYELIRTTIDTTVLVDISKSLAVIADVMTEQNKPKKHSVTLSNTGVEVREEPANDN